jgi:type IV secretion system protein TrbL
MKKISFFLLFILGFLSSAAFAQSAPAVGLLDGILQNYQSATSGWLGIGQSYALQIFVTLGGISISFFGVKIVFDGGDLSALIGKIALYLFWAAFFFTVIFLAPTWVPLVTKTFMVIGSKFAASSGEVITSPSKIMDIGVGIADAMFGVWKTTASGSVTSIGNDFLLAVGLSWAAVFAMAGFAIIALQLLLTQVELSIISALGLVMLGFLAAPASKSIGEKYFSYLISVGVKLMFILALASLGPSIGTTALAKVQQSAAIGNVPISEILGLSLSILIYGILCLQIPAMASGMLSGSVATSLGGMAGAAMAATGAAIGAGMAAAGMASGAAKAAGGAMSGGSSALDNLSKLVAGGGDVTGAGSALGSTLGSMSPTASGTSSSSSFGSDPFAGSSGGGNSIGGSSTPTPPTAPQAPQQSTLSKGLDKLHQGTAGLAASEGGGGGSADINTSNSGS